MKVVHCKRERYTKYIGRGSVLGNPFTHLPLEKTKAVVQVASIEEAVTCCEQWLRGDPKWAHIEPERRQKALAAIAELKQDDVLGCYCKPYHACHGDPIVKIWEELRAGRQSKGEPGN